MFQITVEKAKLETPDFIYNPCAMSKVMKSTITFGPERGKSGYFGYLHGQMRFVISM